MAGVKRKASADDADLDPDNDSATANGAISTRSRAPTRQTRGRPRGKTSSAIDHDSEVSPNSAMELRTPPRKRARRSKDESSSRKTESPVSSRATRSSRRIKSDPQNTARSFEESPTKRSTKTANEAGSDGSPIVSRSSSFKSMSTEPTAPDRSFQDGSSSKVASEPYSPVEAKDEDQSESKFDELDDSKSKTSNDDDDDDYQGEDSQKENTLNADMRQDTESAAVSPVDSGLRGQIPKLIIPDESLAADSGEAETPAGQDISAAASPAPTLPETVESTGTTTTTGRWRGGFRGTRRGARGGRGRNGRGRGGKIAAPPPERDLSPKVGAMVQQLRNRQRELGQAFRKVAASQRTALLVLATRSESRLMKDPKAHTSSNLYQTVLDDLEERLNSAHDLIKKEYEYREHSAKIWLSAEEHRINSHFENKIENAMNEHIAAAQGTFMESLEESRQAEDEDHTEPENSESEPATPVTRRFVRGFDSSFVRDPDGAALHERVENGWEDLVQRAKIGEEIWPQMVAMDQEAEVPTGQTDIEGTNNGRFSNPRFSRLMGALVDACKVAEGQKKPKEERDEMAEAKQLEQPSALDALAEAALDRDRFTPAGAMHPGQKPPEFHPLQPSPSRTMHRPILPHPMAHPSYAYPPRTDSHPYMPPYQAPQHPPSISLPPPPPPPPPATTASHGASSAQQRPLAPAFSRPPLIPPLSEHLRLPDPFSNTAPPLLPAPHGMAYHHPGSHQPPPYPVPQQHMQATSGPMGYGMYPPNPYPHLQYLPPPPQPPSGAAGAPHLPMPGSHHPPQPIQPPPYHPHYSYQQRSPSQSQPPPRYQ